jgi:predicted MFS family arabinose efflux permease
MTIYWGRVIGGALLLELVLFAVLVPIGAVNRTLFLVAVPVGAFVFGYVVSWWVFRKVWSAPWVNTALLGVLATAIYFGIVIASAGIGAAIATYGLPLFMFANAMRVAGCLVAAFHLQRRAVTSPSTAERQRV